jgi:predicted cupin superfamily sugar epimerase
MIGRVEELTARLGLSSHPEGGRFAEVFRSAHSVQPADGRPYRSAMTSIYFLLSKGETARWHQVLSDEIWHYYEGDPLELYWIDPATDQSGSWLLGSEQGGAHSIRAIPAGFWQAARTLGEYTLAGCTVSPGFEFADYRLFAQGSAALDEIGRHFPGVDF